MARQWIMYPSRVTSTVVFPLPGTARREPGPVQLCDVSQMHHVRKVVFLAGERSGLFLHQIRIIKEMRDADKKRGRTGLAVRPKYLEGTVSSKICDKEASTAPLGHSEVFSRPNMQVQTFVAAFSAGTGACAGSIGYQEETAPTLKGTGSAREVRPPRREPL